MAEAELVDGDGGWISDESEFYGDYAVRSSLEQKCKRQIEESYNPFVNVIAKKIKVESKQISKDDDVRSFLKSRPQIAGLEERASSDRRTDGIQTRHVVNREEAADMLYNDRFEGHPGAWQSDETIDEFLKRLPVAEPSIAKVGPWLWVGNPRRNANEMKRELVKDIGAFTKAGEALLEAFLQQKSKLEATNAEKASATITRYMRRYREQLEEDILHTAVKFGTTCGKWMLFPSSSDLPQYWRVVAEATSRGKLGPISKVGTYDPSNSKNVSLICVYTYDFTDLVDVRRVLEGLMELNLFSQDGIPIYYKTDAYTYLDIKSDNSYKLRASLFSSKEMLRNGAGASHNGLMERLNKRKRSIDDSGSS